MKQNQAIKTMMNSQSLRYSDIQSKVGYKSTGTITNLTKENYRVAKLDTFIKIANACGYDLFLISKDKTPIKVTK